jgi:uncharacterized delta-60 repeat protein/uncharacterized repeat protein (TIGR02543 family)
MAPVTSPIQRQTHPLIHTLLGVTGLVLMVFLMGCSSSNTTSPDSSDAKVLEVTVRENAAQYIWNDADMSGQVDVVDKSGKVATLATGRRLVLSDGATVRLSGAGLQGVTEAQVWVFSTPRLLNKIPVKSDGTFSAQIIVPSDLEPGEHTVLISATLSDGRVVAVNIPAFVPEVEAKQNPIDAPTSTAPSSPSFSPTSTTMAPRTTTTLSPSAPLPTTTTPAPPNTVLPSLITTTTLPSSTTTTVPPTSTTTTTTTTTVPAPATYSVTYHGNTSTGGSVPVDASAYNLNSNASVLDRGTLVKTGYTFNGWCTTQPTPGTTCSGTARAVNSTFTVSSDTTLYAVWATAVQTITYAPGTGGTGTGPSTPATVLYGSTFTTPTNTYTRPGHVFAGWNDGSATYSTTSTYPASGAVVTGNVTLTATWTPLTYSITFYDSNSGSGGGADGGTPPATQTGSGVASVTLNANTLSLSGYAFAGWSATNGSTTVTYNNAAVVSISSDTTLHLYPVWRLSTFSTQTGTGASGQVNAAGIQSDGKIIVVGSYIGWNGTSLNRVVRLFPDGSRDASFSTALGSGPSGSQDRILVQQDNKIIISGAASTWSGSPASNRLVRLNSDGSLDTAFNNNLGTGPNSNIFANAQQPDGKLIFAGQFTTWNGTAAAGIVRLNTDGSLDTAFNNNLGTAVGDTPATHSITGVGLQSDGKTIVVGNFTTWNGTTVGRIVRLNSDGTRDTSLQSGTGASSYIYQLRIQPNDAIILAGNFTTYNGTTANRVLRLHSDGSLDTAFSTNIGSGPGSLASRLAIQSDGKILVTHSSTTWSGTTVGSLVRLNSNGTRDTSFTTVIGTALTANEVLSMTPDGNKMLVMGSFRSWKGTPVGRIVRLNSDGTID